MEQETRGSRWRDVTSVNQPATSARRDASRPRRSPKRVTGAPGELHGWHCAARGRGTGREAFGLGPCVTETYSRPVAVIVQPRIPPITTALIVATLALSIVAAIDARAGGELYHHLALLPEAVWRGQVWRLM